MCQRVSFVLDGGVRSCRRSVRSVHPRFIGDSISWEALCTNQIPEKLLCVRHPPETSKNALVPLGPSCMLALELLLSASQPKL